jgi:AcrR family transcriptional regulator
MAPHRNGTNAAMVRAIERLTVEGASVEAACRANGISAPTFYRWRRELAAAGDHEGVRGTERTRQAVLAAATTIFLRDGFGGSMGHVAALAGVSRRTVYNLFDSRDRLFGEAVQALSQRHIAPILLLATGVDFRTVLEECARHQIELMTDPEAVGLMRITLGEYREHPELATIAYAMRAGSGNSTVTNALAQRLVEEIGKGAIDPIEPILAAQTFVGSCTAHLRHRALIGFEPPAAAEIDRRVEMAVNIFLSGIGYRDGAPAERAGQVRQPARQATSSA